MKCPANSATGHSNSLSDPTSMYDVLIAMLLPRGLKQCVVTMLAHVAASAMKDMNSIIVCLYETLDVILSSFGNGVNDHADDERYVFDRR